MQLPVNTLLRGGTYRIVRFISSGGFGCTYEAEHIMLEKRVAIKEFFVKDFCNRDETTAHVTVGTISKKGLVEKLRRKFVDEAKALCKLHHRGIVSVSDVFEENGTAYFVMDYVDGKSLSELVRAEGPLSEERAVRYIRKVAEALKYVHDNNRLHLDIKPGNIMIDSEDNPVLIDFGASKQYDEEAGENTSTLMGKTPGYAPLEQMGNDVVKFLPATDIYALAATLYKLLTGNTPLSANMLACGEQLAPLPASVSAATRNAIAVSMEINKNKRPQNVGEFLALLDSGNTAAAVDDEATAVVTDCEPQPQPVAVDTPAVNTINVQPTASPKKKFGFAWIAVVLIVLVGGALGYMGVSKLREAGRDAKEQLAAEREALAAGQQALEEKQQQFVTDSIARSKRIQARRDSVARAEQLAKEQTEKERLAKEQAAREQAAKVQTAKERVAKEQASKTQADRQRIINMFEMVYVAGGTFNMGATPEQSSDAYDNEKPVHRVTISNFYIGKYEVTQKQWVEIMGTNPSKFKGENLPVENVSWNDVQEFIKRLNAKTGKSYRLPTEAEWEYAARGGNKSRHYKYSGGDDIDKVAWYNDNSGGTTHPVGVKLPNELGIYDMSGNVSEWCYDQYGDYSSVSQTNPKGPSYGRFRVIRGGRFRSIKTRCRVSYRNNNTPVTIDSSYGFRLALDGQ